MFTGQSYSNSHELQSLHCLGTCFFTLISYNNYLREHSYLILICVIGKYLGLGTSERKHSDLLHYSLVQKVQVTQLFMRKVSPDVIQHHKIEREPTECRRVSK